MEKLIKQIESLPKHWLVTNTWITTKTNVQYKPIGRYQVDLDKVIELIKQYNESSLD